MSWFRRLGNAFRPNHLDADLQRELDFHLAEKAEELTAKGMSPSAARLEARKRFGNRTLQQEDARSMDLFGWLDSFFADVRYAMRSLRASPGFASVAVLSLAFGIGANTAIFSLTNALILRSLPVSHPEQLVKLAMGTEDNDAFTNPLWEQVRDNVAPFAGAVAYAPSAFNIAKGGLVHRLPGAWVSGDFFRELGVQPVAGRLLQVSDDHRGCSPTAVVSEGVAQSEFGGVSNAVGKTIPLEGKLFDVVGVVDPRFFGLEVGRYPGVYVPQCAQPLLNGKDVLDARSRWYLNILLRPRAGVTAEQLDARLKSLAPGIFSATVPANFAQGQQADYRKNTFSTYSAANGMSQLRSSYSAALYILMAVVGVVLIIACANIANLLLARAAARQREIAIRLAIGAGRGRVVRQLLTESLLLSFFGAALGVLFARWASRLLVGYLSSDTRTVWLDLSIDGRVLGFTIAVATLTATFFGLAPAWRASQVQPQSALKSGGRGMTDGDAKQRVGRSLVIAQVAMSLALVASSGLLLASFRKLVTLDPGFRSEGVLLVNMHFKDTGLEQAPRALLQGQILDRLRRQPGVVAVGASLITPLGNMGWNESIAVADFGASNPRDSVSYFNQVSDGYFSAMGTRLVAGRDMRADEIAAKRPVAVVNEAFVKHFLGRTNPIGRTLRIVTGDSLGIPREIVGVVADAKYQSLDEKPLATTYLPLNQGDIGLEDLNYEVRMDRDAAALVPAIRAIVREANPAISLEVTTFSGQVAASLARPRLLATLSGFFGALALLLAVIGLYGTMSYNVTRRRNEIGVRMALGAARQQVMRMVMGEAGRLIAVGIVFGALLSLASTRFIASMLYGLSATEPAVFGIAVVLLAVVAGAAAVLPAWRASMLDPMDALREE